MNVFFDMDGTLIDSANAITCAVNEIRSKLNLSPLSREDILRHINTPGTNGAKELYGMEDWDVQGFKDGFERYFLKHYEKSVILFDGVLEILDFLKKQGCYLAIATNAPQNSLVTILKRQNILHYFDKILGVSAGVEPKPSPMMLKLLKDEAPHPQSIFIGDSQKDREAAKGAALPYYHARWYAKNLAPDEFSSAQECIALLKKHL